jgi:hypothetical protein
MSDEGLFLLSKVELFVTRNEVMENVSSLDNLPAGTETHFYESGRCSLELKCKKSLAGLSEHSEKLSPFLM